MSLSLLFSKGSITAAPAWASGVGPGFFVSLVVAITAQFLSEHYGAPAMLLALLLGIAFHFLSEETIFIAGFILLGITYFSG